MAGDSSIDAAIDAYSTNRDIKKFLDTLQRLSKSEKPKAMETVARTKLDLLRQSLAVLVQQGQITQKGAYLRSKILSYAYVHLSIHSFSWLRQLHCFD
jgi:hypothetical protein